jgi:hypothetical protein
MTLARGVTGLRDLNVRVTPAADRHILFMVLPRDGSLRSPTQ